MSKKLYTERNARKQGQVYMDHVMAMTTEELHSKADIASELAHRDIRIAELEQALRDATGAMMQAAGLHKNLSLLMKAEELRKIAEVSDV